MGAVQGFFLKTTLITTDFKVTRSTSTTAIVSMSNMDAMLTVDSCRNACGNAVSRVGVEKRSCRPHTTSCALRGNVLDYSFPRVKDVPKGVAVRLRMRMSRRANRVATFGNSGTKALAVLNVSLMALGLSSLASTGIANGAVRFALTMSNGFLNTSFPTSMRFIKAGWFIVVLSDGRVGFEGDGRGTIGQLSLDSFFIYCWRGVVAVCSPRPVKGAPLSYRRNYCTTGGASNVRPATEGRGCPGHLGHF